MNLYSVSHRLSQIEALYCITWKAVLKITSKQQGISEDIDELKIHPTKKGIN